MENLFHISHFSDASKVLRVENIAAVIFAYFLKIFVVIDERAIKSIIIY